MPRDPDRPIDPNVLSDERCLSGQGTEVRLIRYRDPVSATVYELLAGESGVNAGLDSQPTPYDLNEEYAKKLAECDEKFK